MPLHLPDRRREKLTSRYLKELIVRRSKNPKNGKK
jgi:hypothetical protein